jgi:hypothetical protein
MQSLTWAQVWTYRLARHYLLAPAPAADLAAVAGAVCGIHAQVMPAAELSLGIRVAGITRQDVRAALWEQRTLVKTVGLRGTIHLFPAADLPLWLAALRTREAEEAKRLARQGLDAAQLETIVATLREVLDGQALTLKQIDPEMERRLGAWATETAGLAWVNGWPRWRMALGPAEVRGVICYGPPQGSEVTFVRSDQWLGGWCKVDPQAALVEVFRRYLHAYGPATARDFAQWFAIPQPAARAVQAAVAAELVEVDVEGDPGFLLAPDLAALGPEAHQSVHLLPHFDCYGIGCHPRPRLFPPETKHRTLAGGQAGPVPVLLVDGVVAGVWKREGSGRRVSLQVEPFAPLTTAQQAQLEEAAARIGAILGVTPTLTIGPVNVRPHL